MFGFDESRDAHEQVYGDYQPHEAKFSHELIGGAAAFEGMKIFEDRQRREGKTVNHAFAKEALAGIAGAEVDRLAETKGMDEYDREKAKRHAERSAENMYDQHYINGQNADQYDPNQYGQPDFSYRQRGFEEQSGFQDQGGFQQGGFQQQAGFQQGGFQQGGFQDQGGFREQGGYRDQGGFQQGGFQDQGGFQQGGFQDQGGYRDNYRY